MQRLVLVIEHLDASEIRIHDCYGRVENPLKDLIARIVGDPHAADSVQLPRNLALMQKPRFALKQTRFCFLIVRALLTGHVERPKLAVAA